MKKLTVTAVNWIIFDKTRLPNVPERAARTASTVVTVPRLTKLLQLADLLRAYYDQLLTS